MRVLIRKDLVTEVIGNRVFPQLLPRDSFIRDDAPVNVQRGWRFRNNSFSAPETFHPNFINAQLAKQALDLSDKIIVRCFESEIAAPQSWISYRTQLRNIIALENDTGAEPIPVPEMPPLPSGLK